MQKFCQSSLHCEDSLINPQSLSPSKIQHSYSNLRLPSNPILQTEKHFVQKQPHQKNYPSRKSHSVSNILYGQPNMASQQKVQGNLKRQTGHHYIDCNYIFKVALQRFRRDHTSKNKQESQAKRKKDQQYIQRRRKQQVERENLYRQRQSSNIRKDIDKNNKILESSRTGNFRSSLANSIPVNPINLKYENNQKGSNMRHADEEGKVNKLVRTHHLQTCGTSGYNIINGMSSNYVQKLLPHNKADVFEQKLQKYYSKFTIMPHSDNCQPSGQMAASRSTQFI